MRKITENALLFRVNQLKETIAMFEAAQQHAKSDPAVLKIQQDLIAKGYPLTPDGIMGPKTKAAMDWQAKSNVRDAGLQATKNMDPNQPAPAVPTDPAKKAAYDAAIKNMDPNQTAPAAPPAQPVAPPQPPAAPPASKGTVQNPAVQDFTNKFLATQDKEAAQPTAQPTGPVTPIKPEEFPRFDWWYDSEQENDQVAKAHGMTGMRDPRYVAAVQAQYDNSTDDYQYSGEPLALRTARGSHAGSHESIEYNNELARILEMSKW